MLYGRLGVLFGVSLSIGSIYWAFRTEIPKQPEVKKGLEKLVDCSEEDLS
jgi:hypothetical protein